MKLSTFLVPALLSTLAVAQAQAAGGDFFGTPNGPAGLGAYPSAPSEPEPPKPATPAKPAGPLAPVAPVAPLTPLPSSLQGLGTLQGYLKAWFSFNSREQGGVAWSSEALGATLSPAAALRDVPGGQRVVDLGVDGAVLSFAPSATIGQRFTLAAWVSFPVRSKAAVIFRGSRGDLLNVGAAGTFGCAIATQNYTFGTALAPTTGWHHVALSVDGRQSALYVDGRLQGRIAAASSEGLLAIGNSPSAYEQARMMSAPMDDVAIFNRELTDAEVLKVASVHAATTLGGDSGSLASTSSGSSSGSGTSGSGTGSLGSTAPILPGQPFKSALDAPAPTPKPEKTERDDDERYYPRRGNGGGGFGGGRGGGRGR